MSTARNQLSATETRNLRTLLLMSVFAPQDIGARIGQARREAALTQQELADLIGVTMRSVQGYEAGDVVPYKHMEKIAGVLNTSLEWLLHGEEQARRGEQQEQLEQRLDRVDRRLGAIEDAVGAMVEAVEGVAQADRLQAEQLALLLAAQSHDVPQPHADKPTRRRRSRRAG